jgi:PPOX class probable F420-dependent enzyme
MTGLKDEQRALLQPHLDQEVVVWLTTVRADGQPQSSPVWFVWDEDAEEFLIYSMPASQKVPNIRANPKVSLNFRGDEVGGDVATIEGEARIDRDAPLPTGVADYIAKYAVMVKEMGSEPDRFAQAYSVAIRVRPTRARVWA